MIAPLNLKCNPDEFSYLQEYKALVESGEAVLGHWMQLNLQFVENGLRNKDFFYCPEKAEKAIRFIETQVIFVADKEGFFILEPWQKYLVACIYGLVDEEGYRKFSEIVIIIGRKQGKSAIAGALEATHAFTQRQPGMQIYNLAPKLKQANIIYSQFLLIAEANRSMTKRGKRRRDDYYIKDKNCTVSPLAFNSKKSDGFNPAMAVFDEFAAWEGAKALDMYNVILSAQGTQPQALNIACSTANFIDGGLYDELFPRCTAVLMGTSEEKELLPFLYMIDDIEKWDDVQELKKALPNLGVSFLEKNLLKDIRKAHQSESYKAEFITKYCNIKQNSQVAWISATDVKATQCEKITPEKFSGFYCVGGVDLSRTTDLTAACVVFEVEGDFWILCHFWIPAKGLKEMSERDNVDYSALVKAGHLSLSGERVIEYSDITQWFLMLQKQYRINPVVIGYDRYSANYWIQEMQTNGFKLDDVNQGTNLTPILYQFEGLIKDGRIKTGTNGLLQQHFMNSAILNTTATTGSDKRIRLVKYDPRKHIDGTAAVIDALTVRDKWSKEYGWALQSNRWKKTEKKEYGEDDFSVF